MERVVKRRENNSIETNRNSINSEFFKIWPYPLLNRGYFWPFKIKSKAASDHWTLYLFKLYPDLSVLVTNILEEYCF